MENTEIIKTDNPNVVIEKVSTTREININGLSDYRDGLNTLVLDLQLKINKLKNYKNLPVSVKEIVDSEIAELYGEIYTHEQEVIRINKLLE